MFSMPAMPFTCSAGSACSLMATRGRAIPPGRPTVAVPTEEATSPPRLSRRAKEPTHVHEIAPDERAAPDRLPEPQHATIVVAPRELQHLIRFLDDRPVCDVGSVRFELRVQSSRVTDPEKCIPRSTLLRVRAAVGYGRAGPTRTPRDVLKAEGHFELGGSVVELCIQSVCSDAPFPTNRSVKQ
jgi:hypothetical protein